MVFFLSGIIGIQGFRTLINSPDSVTTPPSARPEIFTVDFTGKTPADLSVLPGVDCKYFRPRVVEEDNLIFFRVNGVGNQPSSDSAMEVAVSLTDTASQIAQSLVDAVGSGFAGYQAARSGTVATFTNQADGNISDAEDFNTGLTITTIQQGLP